MENDIYIQRFVEDQKMFYAVKSFFEELIREERLDIRSELDNQLIGEITRATRKAEQIIDDGFRKLLRKKVEKQSLQEYNPAV